MVQTTSLTQGQLEAISIIERVNSVLSLLGSLFIIVTFCFSKAFHKPINRLVFYATFGNMLTNVGTLMSRSYNSEPNSVGCQFQSFLIQMFMPADAFWILAMAINVYLTFYFKFDSRRLRKMEIPYFITCYGIPMIPAIVYLFLENKDGQRVYGNATLWCWVVPEWGLMRIATFYGPVWILILLTFFIYIRAGRTIYEKRRQLHDFSNSDPDPLSVNGEGMGTIKTTEVRITTEIRNEPENFDPMSRRRRESDAPADGRSARDAYTITISAETDPYAHHNAMTQAVEPSFPRRPVTTARRRTYEVNNAAWAYTKCALLFFTALLITWIPSSANRVYSFVHAKSSSPPLEFMSAFVLPLQGWWNAVIYVVTSWKACKNLRYDWRLTRRPSLAELVIGKHTEDSGGASGMRSQARNQNHLRSGVQLSDLRPGNKSSPKNSETESMTEFAHTRDTSEDEGPRV
ncbi:G-protein coupled receptor [Sarocladium strictum]